MRAKLVVVGGDTKTPEVELRLPAVLGRGREATLTLPHPLVSRQHCEILESDGQLVVRDLGSLNGTFVANERVNEAVLDNGQLLTVGTVTFRAVYLDETSPMPCNGEQPDAGIAETMQMEETVPAPGQSEAQIPQATPAPPGQKIPEAQVPQAGTDMPPMASPVPDDDGDNQAEDDDDLSAFFDSLQ